MAPKHNHLVWQHDATFVAYRICGPLQISKGFVQGVHVQRRSEKLQESDLKIDLKDLKVSNHLVTQRWHKLPQAAQRLRSALIPLDWMWLSECEGLCFACSLPGCPKHWPQRPGKKSFNIRIRNRKTSTCKEKTSAMWKLNGAWKKIPKWTNMSSSNGSDAVRGARSKGQTHPVSNWNYLTFLETWPQTFS